jgi:hypothetical protein
MAMFSAPTTMRLGKSMVMNASYIMENKKMQT